MGSSLKQNKTKTLNLEYDTTLLSPQQIRLIRTLSASLEQLLETDNEEEFFECSAELLKLSAKAIKISHFAEQVKGTDKESYLDQAVEYSLDSVEDGLENHKILTFDN